MNRNSNDFIELRRRIEGSIYLTELLGSKMATFYAKMFNKNRQLDYSALQKKTFCMAPEQILLMYDALDARTINV
jgi:hypothetical protein